MNDHDLERSLRTQRGPREEGYTPARLPMTPEEATTRSGRSPRLPRALMLVGAGAAGALAVAAAAVLFSGQNPGVGSGAGSPSARPSAPVDALCGAADLLLTAEPWGGAAGSRGTVVTIAVADGHSACLLTKGVSARVEDADGTVLVESASGAVGESVELGPGGGYTIGVAWSNWCGSPPVAPVALSIRFAPWPTFVAVDAASGGIDPVPPCNGNGPSNLSLRGLQPAT